MAYYTALQNFWPSAPPGSTQSKMDWVNAQTVTGAIPAVFPITGLQIMNCLDYAEFKTLTADKQTNILQVCQMDALVGGANTFIGKMFADYYSAMLAGPTIAAFVFLAKAVTQPWWKANGYPTPIDFGDVAAAGLS